MKKIYETIAEKIENMIEAGSLKGGDKIPPERKLAEIFNVSRNTVREAIRVLTEKKVLSSRVGSGTYVAKSALSILMSSIDEAFERKKNRLKEIFEVRKILEPQIAALASKKISPKDLALLSDIVERQKKALENNQDTREFDEQFHRVLVESTGNRVLCHIYEKLNDILSESRAVNLQDKRRKEQSLKTHMDILEAISSKSPDISARKMKQHMLDIEKSLELLENSSRKSSFKPTGPEQD